jgi:thiamine biosynthesis protein ThiS
MITVNTREQAYQAGMTVRDLLDRNQFTFRHIIVRVNGEYVPEEQYDKAQVRDGDDVLVLHLMAGG